MIMIMIIIRRNILQLEYITKEMVLLLLDATYTAAASASPAAATAPLN